MMARVAGHPLLCWLLLKLCCDGSGEDIEKSDCFVRESFLLLFPLLLYYVPWM